MDKFNDDSCFLFADSGFMAGAASIIDIGGTLVMYNESKSGQDADTRAIASDWAVTGKDINNSVEKFEKEAR